MISAARAAATRAAIPASASRAGPTSTKCRAAASPAATCAGQREAPASRTKLSGAVGERRRGAPPARPRAHWRIGSASKNSLARGARVPPAPRRIVVPRGGYARQPLACSRAAARWSRPGERGAPRESPATLRSRASIGQQGATPGSELDQGPAPGRPSSVQTWRSQRPISSPNTWLISARSRNRRPRRADPAAA